LQRAFSSITMRFAGATLAVAALVAASATTAAATDCTINFATTPADSHLEIGQNALQSGDKWIIGTTSSKAHGATSGSIVINGDTYAVFRCDNPFLISSQAGIFCSASTGVLQSTAFPSCKDTCTVEYEYDYALAANYPSHWVWNGQPKVGSSLTVTDPVNPSKVTLTVAQDTTLFLGCDAGYGLSGVANTRNTYLCAGSASGNTWGLAGVKSSPSSISPCYPLCNITWPAHGSANGLRVNSYANMATDVTYACDTNYALRDRCVQPQGRSLSAGKVHCFQPPIGLPPSKSAVVQDQYLTAGSALYEQDNHVMDWWNQNPAFTYDVVVSAEGVTPAQKVTYGLSLGNVQSGYNPFPYTPFQGLFSTPAECALTCSDAFILNGQTAKLYDLPAPNNARCAPGADHDKFQAKAQQVFVKDAVRFQCNPGFTLFPGELQASVDSTTLFNCLGAINGTTTKYGGYDKQFPTCVATQCDVNPL